MLVRLARLRWRSGARDGKTWSGTAEFRYAAQTWYSPRKPVATPHGNLDGSSCPEGQSSIMRYLHKVTRNNG
jgi:hypothetical protein